MEHEDILTLMMDALDGELADDGRQRLAVHLRACPECREEWQALVAIDTLFRQTPALSPAVGFTERTLARLPNRRVRLWAISSIYVLVLLSGLIPLLFGLWAVSRLQAIFSQPAVVESITESLQTTWQVAATLMSALLSSVGEIVVQQPTVLGWLLVMIGVVAIWGGVYRQLVAQPDELEW